ncbi:MAG: polysaccharide pyruvyl transferase CsaB [Clostridia bacterium]|nr:polysaccharide pyruvyl transferase CsaB [Clostridia bacterium]
MNILMVTMQMQIGGAETHILELCRALVHRGHHITLASNGGVYADMLAEEGVELVTLPLHTKSPAAVAASFAGLDNCIRQGNAFGDFDLVHAHARIPAWICGQLWDRYRKHPLKRKGREVPLFRFVTTAHLNFSINPLWRRISRWGERTMSVSEDIVDYLVNEYGFARERIQTTINGIDLEKFSPDTDFSPILEEFGLERYRRRLVYMSRLDEDRAAYAYTVARIAPALAEKHPDLDILIVGGGTEEAAIRTIAEQSNQKAGRKIVTMTGGRADINRFCAAADVFIGVSRSVLEAMAASKPVIVAGNQGALGIFDESKLAAAMDTNFCCRGCGDFSDEALLAEIETLLARSPEELTEMGRWCRDVIRQYYTAERMARDYEELYRRAMASPVVSDGESDVILSGYYGFGNMGDESLLSVISSSLAEACPGVKITALTRFPKKDAYRTGLRCVNRMHLFSVWREMGRSRLFLSGGGSLLQDATSGKSLQYYTLLLSLAKKRGMQTMVYANGIGPILRAKNRTLAGETVSACDKVSVRDPDSLEELVSMGVDRAKIRLSADPAFLLTPPAKEERIKILRRLGLADLEEGRYVVLSLRRLGRGREHEGDIRLAKETGRLCDMLQEKYGLQAVLVPMQPQNDAAICAMAAEHASSAVRIVHPVSAEDMLAVTTGAKMAVGMRLHCLIYAAAAGVPVVGLSYDPKIDALMKCLHQPYVYDASTADADTLASAAADILQKEDAVRAVIREAADLMRQRCMEDVKTAAEIILNAECRIQNSE